MPTWRPSHRHALIATGDRETLRLRGYLAPYYERLAILHSPSCDAQLWQALLELLDRRLSDLLCFG